VGKVALKNLKKAKAKPVTTDETPEGFVFIVHIKGDFFDISEINAVGFAPHRDRSLSVKGFHLSVH